MFFPGDYIQPLYEVDCITTFSRQRPNALFIPLPLTVYPSQIFKVYDCQYSKSHKSWHLTFTIVGDDSLGFIESQGNHFKKITDPDTLANLKVLYE